MSFTEPLYAAPITLSGTETIEVKFSAGLSSDYTATLDASVFTAGGIYNRKTNAGSFAAEIIDALNDQEAFAGNTASWAASTPGSGLTFRLVLTRSGDTGDVMSEFNSSINITHFGFTSAALTPGTELANSAPNTVITGLYQRGYLWLPRKELLEIRTDRVGMTAVAISNDASKTVVDGYLGHGLVEHVHTFILGALVKLDKSEDVQDLGFGDEIPGITDGDPNICFETFWAHLQGNRGAAPVVVYQQDSTDSGTTEDIIFAASSWYDSTASILEEMSTSPLLYRVTMSGVTSG